MDATWMSWALEEFETSADLGVWTSLRHIQTQLFFFLLPLLYR